VGEIRPLVCTCRTKERVFADISTKFGKKFQRLPAVALDTSTRARRRKQPDLLPHYLSVRRGGNPNVALAGDRCTGTSQFAIVQETSDTILKKNIKLIL
jgi:hypothetical protein